MKVDAQDPFCGHADFGCPGLMQHACAFKRRSRRRSAPAWFLQESRLCGAERFVSVEKHVPLTKTKRMSGARMDHADVEGWLLGSSYSSVCWLHAGTP